MLIFGVLALGGMAVVLSSLRTIRNELKTMTLESDDFRERVETIGESLHDRDSFRVRVKGIVEEACTGPLKARVKTLEALARVPETTAIPRERLDA